MIEHKIRREDEADITGDTLLGGTLGEVPTPLTGPHHLPTGDEGTGIEGVRRGDGAALQLGGGHQQNKAQGEETTLPIQRDKESTVNHLQIEERVTLEADHQRKGED